MPNLIITEILRDIKGNLPSDIQERYKNIFIAKNVTAILEERGILAKSDNGGRLPTQIGNDIGIFTENRTNNQTGENYIQVVYSEAAVNYVRNLLFAEYPDINPDAPNGFTITTLPALTGAGRRTIKAILEDNDVEIALCKYHNEYWTYDETAIALCEILGIEPHKNADGQFGVAIDCNMFFESVLPVLKENGVNFAINDEQLKIFRKTSITRTAPISTVAKVGSVVMLRDIDGEILNVYLSERERYTFKTITRQDGQDEIIREPITTINGYTIIHPGTPLFDEIIGKREHEIVCFNGYEFEIVGISDDEHL